MPGFGIVPVTGILGSLLDPLGLGGGGRARFTVPSVQPVARGVPPVPGIRRGGLPPAPGRITAPPAPPAPPVARIRRPRRPLSPYTMQTNAAFSPGEMSNFLLGYRVACRSSWVNAAQWNEDSSNLTLNLGTAAKDYDFPDIDEDGAVEFAESFSKGFWYWSVWVGKYGREKPVALEPSGLPYRVRRVLD
jgi:hypothetical protein